MTPQEEKAAAAAIRLAEELGAEVRWKVEVKETGRRTMTFAVSREGMFIATRTDMGTVGPTMPEAVAALRQRDVEREE